MFNIVPLTDRHMKDVGYKQVSATVRGCAMVDGEKTLGIAGLCLGDGHLVLAAKLSQELYSLMRAGRGRKEVLRGTRQVLEFANDRRLPVYSIAEPNIYGSENMLRHLGFKHKRGPLWVRA